MDPRRSAGRPRSSYSIIVNGFRTLTLAACVTPQRPESRRPDFLSVLPLQPRDWPVLYNVLHLQPGCDDRLTIALFLHWASLYIMTRALRRVLQALP
jgi:hypothetical protein